MKLWIVGANGLVGKTLYELAKQRNISCRATSRQEVDICDLDAMKQFADSFSPTHIINAAAYTLVDLAETERDLAFQINAAGPENLGKIAEERRASLLHLSTDYVFDGKKDSPYVESDPGNPINIYGSSKWEGEKRLLEVFPSACIVRTSWVFGRGGKNFISSLLQNMQKEREIRAVTDQIGRPTYCKDLAEALFTLVSHSGIFHFANESAASRFEVAEAILRIVKRREKSLVCQKVGSAKSEEFITPAKRPSYSVLSIEKVTHILGKAPRSWQEAFEDYLDEKN